MIECEISTISYFEELLNIFVVLFLSTPSHRNVIQINISVVKFFLGHYIIHNPLKYSHSIRNAEWNSVELIKPSIRFKCCKFFVG